MEGGDCRLINLVVDKDSNEVFMGSRSHSQVSQ